MTSTYWVIWVLDGRCAKTFPRVTSQNSKNSTMRQVLLMCPFYRWRNCDLVYVSHLPKVTQLIGKELRFSLHSWTLESKLLAATCQCLQIQLSFFVIVHGISCLQSCCLATLAVSSRTCLISSHVSPLQLPYPLATFPNLLHPCFICGL